MPEPTFDGAVRAVETVLYSVSTVLYLPVLVAIAALLLYMLACLGAFLGEWRERRRGARLLVDGARAAIDTCVRESAVPLDAHLERIVQSAEAAGLRRLDAVRFVNYYILHRQAREDSILHRLAKGAADIPTIVRAIYIGIDPRLTGAAGLSVLAHMEDLVARGQVETDGLPAIDGVFRLKGA